MFDMHLKFKNELSIIEEQEVINIFEELYEDIYESITEIEDIQSVLSLFCEVLFRSNSIEFHISGFGETSWNVSSMELCCVLEEFSTFSSSIISNIQKNLFNFYIDFYEQGVERTLKFEDEGDNVKIFCESRTNWIPNPTIEKIEKEKLKIMLEKFHNDFFYAIKCACPFLLDYPTIREVLISSGFKY